MRMVAPNETQFFIDNEVIILSKHGIWLADGVEISHEPTRRLFARSLKKDAEGYFLHIGRETKRIQIEDTAYFVHRLDGDLIQGYEIVLSDETREFLAPPTLHYKPGRLTCRIKSGEEEAKFLHSAYFDLLRHLQEDHRCYYLEIGPEKQRIELALKNPTGISTF